MSRVQQSDHSIGRARPEVVLDGRYALEEVIGRGGMGEVWAATDRRLARPVAVKILAPHLAEVAEARLRFEHEASAAAGLTDPSIVTVFDCGEDDGVPYLVMERLPGSTLADEIRVGPVAPHARDRARAARCCAACSAPTRPGSCTAT